MALSPNGRLRPRCSTPAFQGRDCPHYCVKLHHAASRPLPPCSGLMVRLYYGHCPFTPAKYGREGAPHNGEAADYHFWKDENT